MDWLPVIAAALACWLANTLYQAWRLVKKGGPAAGGQVCVLMGNQAEVAEWFLRKVGRCEGLLSGRLSVVVAAERTADDTAGIVQIAARQGGFCLMDSTMWPERGWEVHPAAWFFDVRGMNSIDLLKIPLRGIMAL
ncbi:MAG: hypothetical protein ACYC4H_01205 [Desulfocucumaceae bacterium]